MNSLSFFALFMTLILFGVSIFIGVQNRIEATELRGKLELVQEKLDARQVQGVTQNAAQQTSIEQQLVSQRQKETELAARTEENDTLEQQFQKIQEKKTKPLTPTQRKIASAPSIAKVTEYLPEYGFVSLDAGSNRRLEPGMAFHIRRNHYVIGKITIKNPVEEATCIADIQTASIPEGYTIEPGDEVIQYIP